VRSLPPGFIAPVKGDFSWGLLGDSIILGINAIKQR
jgi:hypothetical protein